MKLQVAACINGGTMAQGYLLCRCEKNAHIGRGRSNFRPKDGALPNDQSQLKGRTSGKTRPRPNTNMPGDTAIRVDLYPGCSGQTVTRTFPTDTTRTRGRVPVLLGERTRVVRVPG